MTEPWHALSVRQPWAALIIHGRKTVEVRTWPTYRRGTVLLHAGKLPDQRPGAWDRVAHDPVLRAAAGITGGIVGVAEIVDCVTYPTAEAFAADAGRHRNAPDWFRPPRLYGFVLANTRPVPFFACPGNTFFFPVAGYEPPAPPPVSAHLVYPPETPLSRRPRGA